MYKNTVVDKRLKVHMGGGQNQERQQPCVLQEKIKEMDSERTGWASVKNLSPQPRQEDRETRLMFPR